MEKENLYNELHTKLWNGIVTFKFEKSNGTTRVARGTLNLEKCGISYKTAGEKKWTPKHLQAYYDLDADGWRCFRKDSVISIDKVEEC